MLFSESLPVASPLNQDICQDPSMQTMWRLIVGLSDKGFIMKCFIFSCMYFSLLVNPMPFQCYEILLFQSQHSPFNPNWAKSDTLPENCVLCLEKISVETSGLQKGMWLLCLQQADKVERMATVQVHSVSRDGIVQGNDS